MLCEFVSFSFSKLIQSILLALVESGIFFIKLVANNTDFFFRLFLVNNSYLF